MIEEIIVKNFKCLKDTQVYINSLTVLTGYNAAGKSSVIQVLLLLAQAARQSTRNPFLALNGPLVKLGSAGDIISYNTTGSVEFSIVETTQTASWILGSSAALGSQFMSIESLKINENGNSELHTCGEIWPIGNNRDYGLQKHLQEIVYVSASRSHDSEAFPSPTETSVTHNNVGAHGQFAPWWYVRLADDDVQEARLHRNERASTFRAQVDAWMGELFPGVSVNADTISKTALTRLQFKIGKSGDWISPSNVGFGLTYAFPIIVALVAAKDGQLIIIDSPEAHLHPRAQSRFGWILGHFARAGVRILVETHSDHILSGIRLSVKDGQVPPEDVFIYFFSGMQSGTFDAAIEMLKVDEKGQVDAWPSGFFDQTETDLSILSGWE